MWGMFYHRLNPKATADAQCPLIVDRRMVILVQIVPNAAVSLVWALPVDLLHQLGDALILGDAAPRAALLLRPRLTYGALRDFVAGCRAFPPALAESVEIAVKYEGYIRRQMVEVAEFARLERRAIPEDIDYAKIDGLRLEAREKLAAIRPQNLGQAGRISGVSPADVAALMLYITSKTRD